MSGGRTSARIVADRLAWVDGMVAEVRALPLQDRAVFFSDRRNRWAAESCLRRALEALLDLGRHLLAKRFGDGVSEYREIAQRLQEEGLLSEAEATVLRQLAGYRNRMVHYYHEIGEDELYQICAEQLGDVERVASALRCWLRAHPEALDTSL